MSTADNGQAVRWFVLKFGGTSVSSADSWRVIQQLVQERLGADMRVLIVHSALAGISNQLEKLIAESVDGQEMETLAAIRQVHFDLAEELGLDGPTLLRDRLEELEQLVAGIRLIREISPRLQARVMALGELMATILGAAYLDSEGMAVSWQDARNLLHSRTIPGALERRLYLAAECDAEPSLALQEELASLNPVVLTQGFIASNARGDTVLLGRGGSDTSAAYLAARIQAQGLEIWTDVPGIFSANPRKVPGARLLRSLEYREAQEIASTGGSVLHPRAIGPARQGGFPLAIRCTAHAELSGTLISDDPGDDAPMVKAISSRGGITLVSMETLGMWNEPGFLAEAFRCFSQLGLSVDLVSTSESNVTVTLDKGVNPVDASILERLRASLERLCKVSVMDNVEVVSLVGRKIRALLHQIGPSLEAFEEQRIHLVSQAASDLNLSFVVEEGSAFRLVKELHRSLVRPGQSDPVFGPTWEELQAGPGEAEPADTVSAPPAWWQERKTELLKIAAEKGSAYVYDLSTVEAAAHRLNGLSAVDRVFYAMKANSNPSILQRIHDAGLCFECVSPEEIERVRALFPSIELDRILFTPNFAPRSEYEAALEQGVWVTLDNLHTLREWGSSFSDHDVILRIDTGQGRGHHEHVRTAGTHSKFGIPLFELDEARALASAAGTRVVGLHAHTGSGILDADNWETVAEALTLAAKMFPEVRFLDLGGGMGVPERPGQTPLNMDAVNRSLTRVRESWPDFSIWLEPGRYLVADAGVLVTTVTQTKGKGEMRYVGVSAGMNSLIRPALYGAYHEIVNLSRIDDEPSEVVSVVGPICETGDRLGSDRLLPHCREGDVLLIATAGAYGYVMSSRYNLREPAVEVCI